MVLVDSAGLSSANTLNGQRSIAPQRAALSSAMAARGFAQVRSLGLWVSRGQLAAFRAVVTLRQADVLSTGAQLMSLQTAGRSVSCFMKDEYFNIFIY